MSQTVSHNDLSPALRVRKFIGSMMPSGMKRAIVRTPAYLDLARYTAPNILRPSVPISARANGWLRELRENGIVRIESDDLRSVADRLDTDYLEKIFRSPTGTLDGDQFDDPRLFARNANSESHRSFGVEVGCWISFKDEKLKPLLRNPEIAAMLYNYYRRQPYYRNQPQVQFISLKPGQKFDTGNEYHVDRFYQVSAMILVSDVTTAGTHMNYLTKSHRRSLLRTGIELPYDECRRRAEAEPERLYTLTGKKGTLFVYDTTGVHSRNLISGSTRKCLIWTVTTGHHLDTLLETTTDWPELKRDPAIVRRMFDKLGSVRQN